MSYILDALKKSEQERGNGNVPGVQTVHSSSLSYNNKKAVWPYFLIAAVLLNFAVILYFVFDKNETTNSNESNTAQSNTQLNSAPALDNTYISQPVEEANNTIISDAPLPTASQKIESVQPEVIPQQIPATRPAQTSDRTIIEYYDLPDAIKQQIPAITISAHVFSSNPAQRSIVVNNNFLEEGEYVIDDLVLYEITSDGAVFSYHDTLFHHGVVSSWQ